MKEENTPEQDDELISKSQLKREAHELHDLGVKIVALQSKALETIPLEGTLLDAVHAARKITAFGGRKRQMQFIAKLLRHTEVDAIYDAMQKLAAKSSQTDATFKSCERWRERLLSDDNKALGEFIESYPAVDRQQLRQSIRNTKKEISANKAPKYFRELFKLLREQIEQA